MTFTDPAGSIVRVPSDAGPGDPQIVIGEEIPPELVGIYGAEITSAVIYRLSATVYAFTAVVNGSPDPYRVEGIVNTTQDTGDQVAEVYRFYYPTGGRPQLWFSSFLLNDIIFDAGSRVSFYDLVKFDGGASFTEPITVTPPAPRRVGVAASGGPPFQNSWSNYGAAWAPARLWEDAYGVVRADGLVQAGAAWAANQVMFSTFGIPDFAPKSRHVFTCRSDMAGGTVRVDVTANGDFILPDAGPAVGGWISLQGISFRSDV